MLIKKQFRSHAYEELFQQKTFDYETVVKKENFKAPQFLYNQG